MTSNSTKAHIAAEGGPSLLGRNELGLWYEAAAELAPSTEAAGAGSVAPDRMQELQQQGEAALENEARLFDRDMSALLPELA